MPRPRARTAALLAAAVLALGAAACSDDDGTETSASTGTSQTTISLPANAGFSHGETGGTATTTGTGVLSPSEEMQQWCDTYPGVALSAEDAVVKYVEDAVCPTYVTIKSGTPVSFKNLTEAPSTVRITTADDTDIVTSPEIAPGETWSYTLDEPATYSFYTTSLPDLRGAIEVQPPE